jgi:hypothetical protein
MHKKPIPSILFNGEKVEAFLLRPGPRLGCLVLANAIKQEKETSI